MQVQFHTDNHIEGTEAMAQWAKASVQSALARFSGQITRVEVHVSDENGGKKNTEDSIQCTLEVRLEGLQPLALKHHGANLNQAIEGAAEKMIRLIENTIGKAARASSKTVPDTPSA